LSRRSRLVFEYVDCINRGLVELWSAEFQEVQLRPEEGRENKGADITNAIRAYVCSRLCRSAPNLHRYRQKLQLLWNPYERVLISIASGTTTRLALDG